MANNRWVQPVAIVLVIMLCAWGCATVKSHTDPSTVHEDILRAVNKLRGAQSLPPLVFDQQLNATAQSRAEEAADAFEASPDNNRLPVLIANGAFARFALSHEIMVGSLDYIEPVLTSNAVAKSKLSHPRLTHMGLGFAKARGKVFVVIDLARLALPLDQKQTRKNLEDELKQKRINNSVEPLEIRDDLGNIAADIATQFMAGNGSSDGLIAMAHSKLNAATFALGRVTIDFQVAPEIESIRIPERASDPALAYVGYGFSQGNHTDHEPGAIAMVFLLAEPQTAHKATRKTSSIPPPKAVKRSKPRGDISLTDQAWTATLTGNHTKAAKLFEQAYKRKKEPILMYESARAHARNGDNKQALKAMRIYASKVTGAEKQKAEKMIGLLEKGETIFTATKQEKMSVEAKRFFVMGQTLFNQGEWDGAVDAFQQAYQYSAHAEIIYNIGLAHLRSGRIGDALNFFGEYQRQVPEASNVEEAKQFFEIGSELYSTGQFESASRHFAMAYSFLPFPELVYNLGLCYKAMGEKDKAIRFFREFLINELPEEVRKEVEGIIKDLKK